MKHGKIHSDDNDAKEKTYALIKEFTKQFKDINGSVKCTELLGYDMSTAEGHKAAREASLWSTVCAKLVRDSSQIVEGLLDLK